MLWWREVVVELLLYGVEEALHGSCEVNLQLVQGLAVYAVRSGGDEASEPVLQACYSLLDCGVDQLSDFMAFTCLEVSGEGLVQQGEG